MRLTAAYLEGLAGSASWLLDIHVLAGLHRIHRTRRVPVIHRRHDDGVNIFSFKQLPVVVEALAIAAMKAMALSCTSPGRRIPRLARRCYPPRVLMSRTCAMP